jgi:putative ABC transport system permease protein
MRLDALLYLYGRRLRTHPIQELLAALGVAVGVALAFAVMVGNGSVTGSAGEVIRGVTGAATLQLEARDSRGFDERLLGRVQRLPGVVVAAPLLDQRAVLVGPSGRSAPVNLVSVDPRLAALSGRLTRSFIPGGLQLVDGAMLPKATARVLGLPDLATQSRPQPLPHVTIDVRGRAVPVRVAAVLGSDTIGPLTGAMVAMLPLPRLQALVGLRHRLTRILVQTKPGRSNEVRRELQALAGQRLAVLPADDDLRILEEAVGPTNEATWFFAAIAALLGFLLAFAAMLLTAPERRRLIAALRIQGFKPRQLVVLILFQSTVLGLVASGIGLGIGEVLSRRVFNAAPDYLAPAFTLGTRTVVGTFPIVVAFVVGIAATCASAAPTLLDLRRARAVDAVFHERGLPGNALGFHSRRRLMVAAIALMMLTAALLAFAPSAALLACAVLALATVCAIATTFALVLRAAAVLARRVERFQMLTVALLALRATTLRSLALAATGAVAVFGSVAIGGARADLLRGIARYTSDYVSTARLWIVSPHDNQATNDFGDSTLRRRVAAVPGVTAARSYQGAFLDVADRRLWIIARPSGDRTMVPASQLVQGHLSEATRRLREGGWAVISQQLASDRHLALGDRMTLPTPTGITSYRIAATTTNLGWAPGSVIINSRDFERDWHTSNPTAIEVDISSHASADATRQRIVRALGPTSGLRVQTAEERADGINASAREGLKRLGQISGLLLAAAVLAMAAAMTAAIWQRRTSLAALRIQSFRPRQVWRILLLESTLVLGAGCLTGALCGLYGQVVIDRYLKLVTGFPVVLAPAAWQTVATFGFVVAAALAVVALPGWLAARVPPHLGLQE